MNRLKYHTCYTAGPVDNVSVEDATTWRKDISQFLQPLGVFCISPMDKPIDGYKEDAEFIAKINQLKKERRYDELHELGKPIRQFDLRCVDVSNFIIAYLDFDVKICGTFNEIFQADLQRKMCLIMCKQGLDAIPNWLYFTFPKECFYESWSDLKQYIIDVDNGTILNPHKRWWLVNYDKILPSKLQPPQLQPPKEHLSNQDSGLTLREKYYENAPPKPHTQTIYEDILYNEKPYPEFSIHQEPGPELEKKHIDAPKTIYEAIQRYPKFFKG